MNKQPPSGFLLEEKIKQINNGQIVRMHNSELAQEYTDEIATRISGVVMVNLGVRQLIFDSTLPAIVEEVYWEVDKQIKDGQELVDGGLEAIKSLQDGNIQRPTVQQKQ